MKPSRTAHAFSLIEVIIAVGLFAGTVAIILGLMGPLSRQAADSNDIMGAQRLPDSIKVELGRLAHNSLDSLAGQIPVMSTPLESGFTLVAARDATRVQSLGYLPPTSGQIPLAEHYYLVECWRFPPKPGDPADELSYTSQKGFLALYVRVSWPYHVPGATTAVSPGNRAQTIFTVSLNR